MNTSKSASSSLAPLNVGIWLPLGPGAHWRGEGIARTIEFIIKGNIKNGQLGKDVVYTFYTSIFLSHDIKISLEETIGDDIKYIRFATVATVDYYCLKTINAIFSLFGLIKFHKKEPIPFNLSKLGNIKTPRGVRRFYATGKARKVARYLGLKLLIDQDNTEYEFPKEKKKKKLDIFTTWLSGFAKESSRYTVQDPQPLPFEKYRFEYKHALKFTMPGAYIFMKIVHACNKIVGLRYFSSKIRGFYFRLSQSSINKTLLRYAMSLKPEEKTIDVWWIVNPNVYGAEFLPGPRVMNFWDFVVGEYGYFWERAAVEQTFSRVKLVCHAADAIITQSHHNRDLKLSPIMNIENDKVNVVYLSYPDHYPQYVPLFKKTGKRTNQSRKQAADIIRHYVGWRLYQNFGSKGRNMNKYGFMMERLNSFSFEDKVFAIISTQDRPYKNLSFMVNAFFDAVNKKGIDAYLILTSEIDLSDTNSKLTKILLKQSAMHRVFSLPRVPNNVHAALYHCASLTIHPSYSEGGVGSYPFVEGMVMGCPGLVAIGDYSYEGHRLHPNYHEIMISPYHKKDAVKKIVNALQNPKRLYEQQKDIFDAHAKWKWSDIASAYLTIMKGTLGNTPFTPAKFQKDEMSAFYDIPSLKSASKK